MVFWLLLLLAALIVGACCGAWFGARASAKGALVSRPDEPADEPPVPANRVKCILADTNGVAVSVKTVLADARPVMFEQPHGRQGTVRYVEDRCVGGTWIYVRQQ